MKKIHAENAEYTENIGLKPSELSGLSVQQTPVNKCHATNFINNPSVAYYVYVH